MHLRSINSKFCWFFRTTHRVSPSCIKTFLCTNVNKTPKSFNNMQRWTTALNSACIQWGSKICHFWGLSKTSMSDWNQSTWIGLSLLRPRVTNDALPFEVVYCMSLINGLVYHQIPKPYFQKALYDYCIIRGGIVWEYDPYVVCKSFDCLINVAVTVG